MRLRKIVVERVTVVKFRVDNRGSDGTGCFRIDERTDTAQLSEQEFIFGPAVLKPVRNLYSQVNGRTQMLTK